ncbi:MAG: hypothetical protein ACRDKX_09660 [Solirubrobacterales bacterium]
MDVVRAAGIPPREDAQAREAWVDDLEDRFAPIASALGLVFLLVVIGEALAAPGSMLRDAFLAVGWLIWAVFVLEFALRAIVAPPKRDFLRRNWWQVLFLVLPFLRFLAVLRIGRVARAGRIVGSALRGTRSAGQVLRSRIMWLATIHVIVVLSGSQLLFEFGRGGGTYGTVLHAVALASVSGEPLGLGTGLSQVLDVVLATYAVVVFGSVAGALGAYFLERRREGVDADGAG